MKVYKQTKNARESRARQRIRARKSAKNTVRVQKKRQQKNNNKENINPVPVPAKNSVGVQKKHQQRKKHKENINPVDPYGYSHQYCQSPALDQQYPTLPSFNKAFIDLPGHLVSHLEEVPVYFDHGHLAPIPHYNEQDIQQNYEPVYDEQYNQQLYNALIAHPYNPYEELMSCSLDETMMYKHIQVRVHPVPLKLQFFEFHFWHLMRC